MEVNVKRKLLIGGAITVVVLCAVGVIWFSKFGVSADSVEATKTTTIQLVDENGAKVEKQMPLSVVFTGTEKKCVKYIRHYLWVKTGSKTVCSIVPASTTGTVLTNEKGQYVASMASYKTLTNEQLGKVIRNLMDDRLLRAMTSEEDARLQKVIDSVGALNQPTKNQVMEIVNKAIKEWDASAIANIDPNSWNKVGTFVISDFSTAVKRVFSSTDFDEALTTGKLKSNFQLTNMKIMIKGNDTISGYQNISFYASEYKESVNLELRYIGNEQLESIKDSYFTEIDKKTTASADSKAVMKQSISDFVDYVSFYFVHLAKNDDPNIAPFNIFVDKASENISKTLNTDAFRKISIDKTEITSPAATTSTDTSVSE